MSEQTHDVGADVVAYVISDFTKDKVIFDRTELPSVENVAGRPKLPAQPQGFPATTPEEKAETLRREALEKVALAEWWEQESERREAARKEMLQEIANSPYSEPEGLAGWLVLRGWRR